VTTRASGIAALLGLALLAGCVSRPPTVAHVHIGHAITGVHVTPGKEGYIVVAQQRAQEALDSSGRARTATDLVEIKRQILLVDQATNAKDSFGVRESLLMAVDHISFAASSDDASRNVQESAPVFARDSAGVLQRCDLIGLLSKDVAASTSTTEANVAVAEIAKLTQANLTGDGSISAYQPGSPPASYGLVELRGELNAMIAREKPPYVTVDQWYLFNLVRLPNGRWVFDKFGRGGNIEGYK
jgi:hypothetical protein